MKSWLKTASGLKAQQFDIQQQALKLTANRLMFLVDSLFTLKAFLDIFLFGLINFRVNFFLIISRAVCMDAWVFPTQDFMRSPLQNL